MNEKRIFWHLSNLQEVPSKLDWLSPKERHFLSGLRFEKRINDWKLGRWTVKNAVKTYFYDRHKPIPLSDMEVLPDEQGIPRLKLLSSDEEIYISLSHSHSQGFCTLSAFEIKQGCDLEYISEKSDLFIKDYFTEEEKELAFSKTNYERALIATLIWSAKESTLKLLGEGLRMDTRSVVVDISPEKRSEQWTSFQVILASSGKRLAGTWRYLEPFVYTAVSSSSSIEMIQLTEVG